MSVKKEHSKGLEEKVKRLKQANHALREHLKAKDEEIDRLKAEIENLNTEIEDYEQFSETIASARA